MTWKKITSSSYECTDAMEVANGVLVRTACWEDPDAVPTVAMVFVPDTRLVGGCGQLSTIEAR